MANVFFSIDKITKQTKRMVDNVERILKLSDEYAIVSAKIALMNDGLQTTTELQKRIFAAAQRSRKGYLDMQETVTNLGMLAGGAFENSREMVGFTELAIKSFQIGGSPSAEQQAGMKQIAQAMVDGKIQGSELDWILKNAPVLADAMTTFTGKSRDELLAMANAGNMTADILKSALFAAADEINAKFAGLPHTFTNVFSLLKDHAFRSFEPVFQRLSEWLNSPQGSSFIQSLTFAIYGVAQAVDWLLSTVQTGWPIVQQVFEILIQTVLSLGIIIAWLSPFILGAVAAWLTYLTITKSVVLWIKIQTAVTGVLKKAQEALNRVMSMSPLNRIITLIIAVITIAAAFFELSKGLKKAFSDAFGFIVDVAEGAINTVISIINGAIWGINKISKFFADLLGVDAVQISEIEFKADFQKFKESGQDLIENFSVDKLKQTLGFERFEDLSRWEDMSIYDDLPGEKNVYGFDDNQWQIPHNIDKIGQVGEVGKIRDTVDINSEDLKIMRELAEMKSIQNFVTLTPSVQVTTGPISKEVDVDTMIARIESYLTEQIASSAQGVYG